MVGRPKDIASALDRLRSAPQTIDLAHKEHETLSNDVALVRDGASDAPVIRLVQDLIGQAVERHASDVHLTISREGARVRLRIDGHLIEIPAPPAGLYEAAISRIKIMSGLDIAEKRLPQDGSARAVIRGKEVDFRVATMPHMTGEGVVLRILDRSDSLRIVSATEPLPDDPGQLKAMVIAERAESERLRQRHRFGRRAESLPVDQLLLGLEEAEQVEAAGFAAAEGATPAERRATVAKRRINRGALPAHLPRIESVVDVESRTCMMREITDPNRVSALRQAQDYLDQHRSTIDWRDRYMATTEEGRSYSLTLVGTAGPNFMARTDAEILVGRSSDLPSPPLASGERFTMTTAVRQELQARDSAERGQDARGINISAVEGERDKQKPSGQKI